MQLIEGSPSAAVSPGEPSVRAKCGPDPPVPSGRLVNEEGATGSKQVRKPAEGLPRSPGCLPSAGAHPPCRRALHWGSARGALRSAPALPLSVWAAVKFSGAWASMRLPRAWPWPSRAHSPVSVLAFLRPPAGSSVGAQASGALSALTPPRRCRLAVPVPPRPCLWSGPRSAPRCLGSSCSGVCPAQQRELCTDGALPPRSRAALLVCRGLFLLLTPLKGGFLGRVPANSLSGAVQAFTGMQPTASLCLSPSSKDSHFWEFATAAPLPGTKMCPFLVVPVTKCHDVGAYNDRDLFPLSWRPEQRSGRQQGCAPPKAAGEGPAREHLGLQATCGVSRLWLRRCRLWLCLHSLHTVFPLTRVLTVLRQGSLQSLDLVLAPSAPAWSPTQTSF